MYNDSMERSVSQQIAWAKIHCQANLHELTIVDFEKTLGTNKDLEAC